MIPNKYEKPVTRRIILFIPSGYDHHGAFLTRKTNVMLILYYILISPYSPYSIFVYATGSTMSSRS